MARGKKHRRPGGCRLEYQVRKRKDHPEGERRQAGECEGGDEIDRNEGKVRAKVAEESSCRVHPAPPGTPALHAVRRCWAASCAFDAASPSASRTRTAG